MVGLIQKTSLVDNCLTIKVYLNGIGK